jgi:hypothetical protein
MNRTTRLQILLGQALLSVACADAGSNPATPVVRDSAGIRIVENSAMVIDEVPQWTPADQPLVDIGVIEGTEQYRLFQVRDARPLGTDEIVVVNGGSDEIRVYDWLGGFVRSFGGTGEGPGEFRVPTDVLQFAPDSLAVWDVRLRRLAVFTTRGQFVRQVIPGRASMNPNLRSVFEDGSFLLSDERLNIPQSGFAESDLTFVRYGPEGEFLDSAAVHSFGQFGRLGESRMVGGPTFSAHAAAAANSKSFWVGAGSEYEIVQHSPSGIVLQLVRWDGPDRTIESQDVDAYWQQLMEGATGDRRRRYEHMRDVTPVADRFPTHGRLVVDELEHVWVEEYRRPRATGPNRWWVFDQDGSLIARAETRVGLTLTTVSEKGLFGIERDSLDVEHVRVYSIERK